MASYRERKNVIQLKWCLGWLYELKMQSIQNIYSFFLFHGQATLRATQISLQFFLIYFFLLISSIPLEWCLPLFCPAFSSVLSLFFHKSFSFISESLSLNQLLFWQSSSVISNLLRSSYICLVYPPWLVRLNIWAKM